MKYFKKLIGDRIYLSPTNTEDAEIFTEWLNDFETTDYVARSAFIASSEGEKKFFEESISDKNYQFFIVTLDDDKLIGTVSLLKLKPIDRTATLGIFIGNKEYRIKGYGTEAIKLLLDFGFNYLNLHSIKLDVLSFNERGIKCYQKCGFKECGRRRECRFINGKYYDSIEMDILDSEFHENYIRNKNI